LAGRGSSRPSLRPSPPSGGGDLLRGALSERGRRLAGHPRGNSTQPPVLRAQGLEADTRRDGVGRWLRPAGIGGAGPPRVRSGERPRPRPEMRRKVLARVASERAARVRRRRLGLAAAATALVIVASV